MKKYLIATSIIGSLFLPMVIFADITAPVASPKGGFQNWVSTVLNNIATPIWQLFAGISVIMFVVAGILFITSNGEPGKITTARHAVIWGAVAIIVASLAFILVQTVSGWV